MLVAGSMWADNYSISFTAAAATAAEVAGQTYGTDFTLAIPSGSDKATIDANSALFGTSASDSVRFAYRLKTGGSSNKAARIFTLTVPEDGTLTIYARTGSSADATRTIVLANGTDTVVNKILLDVDTVVGGVNGKKCFIPVTVDVTAGEYQVTYPVNSINIYGFNLAVTPKLDSVNTIANVKACYAAGTLKANDSIMVKGYIVNMFLKPTNFTKYGSVSIWMTDTLGGTTKEFELYNCYGTYGDTLASFSPENTGSTNIDVDYVIGRNGIKFAPGDLIVAKGKFYLNKTTYELNQGCFIVEGGSKVATAFENTTAPEQKAVKVIENGQIVIIKNGVRYNALGATLK